MATLHKLQVKIGQHEFSAEGSQETVQAQFQQFLEIINRTPGQKLTLPTDQDLKPPNGGDGPIIMPAELDRVFRLDRSGIVSLRTLPSTKDRDFDTLVLLMYGFQKIKDQHDTSATQLMIAARQSGLTLDRFDRLLGGREDFARRGGKKKGTRYSLTNPGMNHAEALIGTM